MQKLNARGNFVFYSIPLFELWTWTFNMVGHKTTVLQLVLNLLLNFNLQKLCWSRNWPWPGQGVPRWVFLPLEEDDLLVVHGANGYKLAHSIQALCTADVTCGHSLRDRENTSQGKWMQNGAYEATHLRTHKVIYKLSAANKGTHWRTHRGPH